MRSQGNGSVRALCRLLTSGRIPSAGSERPSPNGRGSLLAPEWVAARNGLEDDRTRFESGRDAGGLGIDSRSWSCPLTSGTLPSST